MIINTGPNTWGDVDTENGGGVAFHELPSDSYPFVICWLDDTTMAELERLIVPTAGSTQIPSIGNRFGTPVRTRMYFSSGHIYDMGPDGIPRVFSHMKAAARAFVADAVAS